MLYILCKRIYFLSRRKMTLAYLYAPIVTSLSSVLMSLVDFFSAVDDQI